MSSINIYANDVMSSGYTPEAPPDPAVLFRLTNKVAADANVFAFQKAFAGNNGKWGFDVYFESDESDEMTCECRDQRC